MRTLQRVKCIVAAAVVVLLMPVGLCGQLVPGSMDVHWIEGAHHCAMSIEPPIQVHPYNRDTFVLRESLCRTSEGPFVYLLVGAQRAMLIDTGDVADPSRMPLAQTIQEMLSMGGHPGFPLLVVHTHRHGDHRAGDAQLAHLPNATVVGFDLDSVRLFFGFTDWPNRTASIDLGGRIVDVLPTPGHSQTELSFYDRTTGLFFSGDFLLPGRLFVQSAAADLASAERVAAFMQAHPITAVLGGHIEENSSGKMFPWKSHYHPDEHALQMSKCDALALPAALRQFNGFYKHNGTFEILNFNRLLLSTTAVMIALTVAVSLWFRRKRIHRPGTGAKR